MKNVKKKIYAFLLVVIAFATILVIKNLVNSYALPENWYEDYTYTLDNTNKTITLTGYNGSQINIEVPKNAIISNEQYQVIINGPVYDGKTDIKSITFADGVKTGTSLNRIFRNCHNLEEVDLSGLDTTNLTNLSGMFGYCRSLNEADLSNFNTNNITDMSAMFYGSRIGKVDLSSFTLASNPSISNIFGDSKIGYLDIRNFDTTNANVGWIFNFADIDKITIGEHTNLKTNTTSSAVFGRGTWVKEEDGKRYTAVEICTNSTNGTAAGTYTKVSNMSKDTNISYTVDYKIDVITKIDSFTTTRSDIYAMTNNAVYLYIPTTEQEEYIVPGQFELIFNDVVSDRYGNRYNLKMVVDNVHYFDLVGYSNVSGNLLKSIVKVTEKGIAFDNFGYTDMSNFLARIGDAGNDYATVTRCDVSMYIVDDSGTPQEGSYIFSSYDLDGNSTSKRGWYGEYSEGINLIDGYDMDTLQLSDPTFLQILHSNRLTGTRGDNDSEFSEFIIKADAEYTKFQWTGGTSAITKIMSYYQPQMVEIIKKDENNNPVAGANLALYYGDDLVNAWASWTSTTSAEQFFLVPGLYTLKEISAPSGYNKSSEIYFYVDINNTLTVDGVNVEEIVVTDNYDTYSYTVNYYDKATNEKVNTSKIVNEVKYQTVILTSNEIVEIDKYDYDSSDVDSITIDYNESNNVINLYYTKKNGKVIVKYVDQDTGGEISDRVTLTGNVDANYETSSKIITNYNLISDTGNTTGTYTLDDIEVIYYYKKIGTVVETHKDIFNNEVLNTETHHGNIGASYNITSKEFTGYDLVTTMLPSNATGTYQDGQIDVIYYYAKKAKVVTKYVDMNTSGEIAARDTINGHVGDEYQTTKKTITSYTYIESTNNTNGQMTAADIEVIYYYKKNAKVIVNHIDETNSTVLETVTHDGLVGDSYTSQEKSFEGYILSSKPSNETVTMTEEDIILNYYYVQISSGLIEKHLDVVTNEVLYTKSHSGNVGDSYSISSKEFTGYDLVTTMLPSNASGTLSNSLIEVVYYYAKQAKVIAKYIDMQTNNEIATQEVYNGHVNDNYVTVKKAITGYTYIEDTGNTSGQMQSEDITVIYYYRMNAKVITKYIDMQNNNEIATRETLDSYMGFEYSTVKKTITGYTYIEDTGNTSGTINSTEITVIYYYRMNAKVITKYIDINTSQEITTREEQNGLVGDSYTTTQKTIAGYTYVSNSNNIEGTMQAEDITVIYYYRMNAKVITKYIDINTSQEISTREEQNGLVGDSYTTTKKNITGYTYVSDSNNTSGTYTADDIEVKYYYKKNAKVIVNHIDNTNSQIMETITHDGLVGDSYTSQERNYTGYVLAERPSNETVTMTEEDIILNYYYNKVSSGVLEKHVDVYNNEVLDSKTHSGNVGDPYSILSKEFTGYDLVTSMLPSNASGYMGNNLIEVIYYYSKIAGVTVKYIDINTSQEISARVEYPGHIGDSYTTTKKTITGYTYVSDSGNTEGTMDSVSTEVVYYYKKNTNVVVNYIDQETSAILHKIEDSGLVGDSYTSSALTFDDYQLYEKPTVETIVLVDGSNVLNYYYVKIKGTVIEKHLDVVTNEVLYTESYTLNVHDNYEILSREFNDYDLVTSRIPDNRTGEAIEGTIEVIYYYAQRAKVIVKYLDKNTNARLSSDETINGHVNELYETSYKDIDNYELVEQTDNTEGRMTEDDITVIYYYRKKTRVTVNYYDKETYQLLDSQTDNGLVGETYEGHAKSFQYYILSDKPENEVITLIDGENVLNYYYLKIRGGVIEKHIDEHNNTILYERLYDKYVGDRYNIASKYFEGYDLDNNRLPNNSNGVIEEGVKEVIYYYKKKANVVVRYVDEVTNDDIHDSVVINGYVGDDYKTNSEDIIGYELVKVPENKDGQLGYNTDEVIYYYRKVFSITTIVNGDGGTIEGDEKVLEGHDSTVGKIIAVADDDHYIDRITINGEDIHIDNLKEMVVPNIIDIHENKEVVVTFKSIVIDNVPKTSSSTILPIIAIIFLTISVIFIAYSFREKKAKKILMPE